MISLFLRFLIIVTVVVSIVDAVRFYAIAKKLTEPMISFVFLMIVATVLPIAVNLWYCLIFRQV